MKRPITLFVLLFILFLWSSRLGLDGYETEYLLSAQNLILNGSFSMYPEPVHVAGVPDRPPGHICLPRHNLLQVLLTVPFFLLGMPLNGSIPDTTSAWFGLPIGSVLFVSLLNPVLTLLAVWLIMCIGHRLGFSDRASWLSGALYGCATMAWPYAGIGMEPLQTAMFLLSFLLYLRLRDAPTPSNTLWFALAIAGLMHTKISAPLPALPIAVTGLFTVWNQPGRFRSRIGRIALFCLLLACATILWFGLYAYRKSTQYTPGFFDNVQWHLIPRNGVGFVVSPGKSLFAYNPILLIYLAGIPTCVRRFRAPSIVLIATAFCIALLIAPWDWSLIEECWGPRYLMPIIPILLILGLPIVDRPWRKTSWIGFLALVMVSMAVQIPGVLYPNANILQYSQNSDIPVVDLTTWTPDLSPIVVGWHLTANKIRESVGIPMVPYTWSHYRGIVGHGTKPTVTTFTDHGKNRPFTLPFLLARYVQKQRDAAASPDGHPSSRHDIPWIFPLWFFVTLFLLILLLSIIGRQLGKDSPV
ncbi:hypothetical protein JXA80_09335 [bacterium]|nr:hypothetical protein [candidate division CSSED10-310 bacterium]